MPIRLSIVKNLYSRIMGAQQQKAMEYRTFQNRADAVADKGGLGCRPSGAFFDLLLICY